MIPFLTKENFLLLEDYDFPYYFLNVRQILFAFDYQLRGR